ncbi:MAG: DUF3579 domain-containing protein [Nitrosomonadales bacterium]|nr:DUF3579 domain-containing protein [Nitrosomonadales bacterium]
MTTVPNTDYFRSLPRAPHAQLLANRMHSSEWLILGATVTGEIFDMPDWPERLCGMLASQPHDQRLRDSDYLRPAHINGLTAVVVSRRLEQDHPASFAIVKQFVAENRLDTRSDRTGESSGAYPVLQQKLRAYIKG